MSQLKVAKITKVNQSTVSRWLCTNNRPTGKNPDCTYFTGNDLKDFVTYLALDAKRISKEVRNHNIKLLSDASDLGFQMLIDRMAGIDKEQKRIETRPKDGELDIQLLEDALKCIFSGVNIKPELVSGLKANAIAKAYPQLEEVANEAKKMLRASTATENELLTPTKLGEKLGGVSAQKVNQLLIDHGLQIKKENRTSRKTPAYEATPKGQEFCTITLSTGKGSDSTSYQQLLWYESVLNIIS
jgi:predicted transcriptional regulator